MGRRRGKVVCKKTKTVSEKEKKKEIGNSGKGRKGEVEA